MEKLDINKSDISIHNVIYAITTQQDYEMKRYLFIKPMYKDILYLKTEDKKCLEYCSVCNFCPYYKEKYLNKGE